MRKSHVAIRLIKRMRKIQDCESRTMAQVTDAEASADCVVMADYNWSLWFCFHLLLLLLSSRQLYKLSAEEQWHLRCLTTSCSAAPPDWQLWSARWQTTRLKGIKEAGTPPSHKLPKKSKLLWERSTLGSRLPRKITAAGDKQTQTRRVSVSDKALKTSQQQPVAVTLRQVCASRQVMAHTTSLKWIVPPHPQKKKMCLLVSH